ncbi:MAG: hypothetical protein ACE5L6_01995 [Candidatus Bathyarchaeia archaeon]
MPRHKTHRKVDRLVLGREYEWVHKLLDTAAPALGPSHRKVGHDQESAGLIFLLSRGDLKALISAELHIALDKHDTELKKMLRKMLFGKKRY